MIKELDIPADYDWNAFYHGNILQRWWKHRIADEVHSMFSKHCLYNYGKILDVGCGTSPIAFMYKNLTGIDIDPRKIEFMEAKADYNQFFTMSAENIQFPDSTFSTVLCIEVIEHLDSRKMMSEISRVLKDDGLLIVATPDYSKILWRSIEAIYNILLPEAYACDHSHGTNPLQVFRLAKKNNLELLEIKYVAKCDSVIAFRKTA